VANGFEVGIDVAVAPGEAWALAGDPGRVGEWFPPVTECVMNGDVRRVTLGGRALVERIVDHDDEARFLLLQRAGGRPRPHLAPRDAPRRGGGRGLASPLAPDRHSDVPGYDIEARLRGVMTAGLESLRERLEG
jgi:hypothetical protein